MECARPNRSDVHLSREEEAKAEAAARDFFDAAAPKRHTKPQRSEYSADYADALSGDDQIIAEYTQFQQLEKDTEKLVYSGSQAAEEFTETEYYKDLGCVDKEHHTTGTGFIKMENGNGNGFSLTPEAATECHASCKGNPATNDWIPAPSGKVMPPTLQINVLLLLSSAERVGNMFLDCEINFFRWISSLGSPAGVIPS